MKQEIKERVEKIRKGEVPEGYRKTKVGIITDDMDAVKFNIANIKNELAEVEVKMEKQLEELDL